MIINRNAVGSEGYSFDDFIDSLRNTGIGAADLTIFKGDTLIFNLNDSVSTLNNFLNYPVTNAKKIVINFNGTLTGNPGQKIESPVEILEINAPNIKPTNLNQAFNMARDNDVKIIKFNFDTSEVTNWSYTFRGMTKIETIDADLDFSASTDDSLYRVFYQGMQVLKDVRIVKNSIHKSIWIKDWQSNRNIPWTDESLVYFANGLNDAFVPNTLTAHINQKSRMDAILGAVEHIIEEDIEYDFFTLDESGTVSLTEFITDYKGWTIA